MQGRISSERLYRCMLLLYVRNLIDYSMLFLDGVTIFCTWYLLKYTRFDICFILLIVYCLQATAKPLYMLLRKLPATH